ncbi:MAG: hypothetical protein K9H16_04730 [Bacteroidales bacterium]|nr:hypothetical protein [Bacteroidales bacterium]
MNKKFENVPVESDTVILFEKEHTIGRFDVLYQIWRWANYQANSIIFANEDIADIEEDEIRAMVKNDSVFTGESRLTFRRSDSGFTFVSFNFEDLEPSFSVDLEKIKKQTQHVEKRKKEIEEREQANKDNQNRQKPIS